MDVFEPVGYVDDQHVMCAPCAAVWANLHGYDLQDDERFGVITCESEVDDVPWCERCGAPIADVTLTEDGVDEYREQVATLLTDKRPAPGWLLTLLEEHMADTFWRIGVWNADRWWPVSDEWFTSQQEAQEAAASANCDVMCEPYTEQPDFPDDAVLHGIVDGGTIVTAWAVEDVLRVRPDLCADEACEVLAAVLHGFDATLGITWETLEFHADTLYPTGGQGGDAGALT